MRALCDVSSADAKCDEVDSITSDMTLAANSLFIYGVTLHTAALNESLLVSGTAAILRAHASAQVTTTDSPMAQRSADLLQKVNSMLPEFANLRKFIVASNDDAVALCKDLQDVLDSQIELAAAVRKQALDTAGSNRTPILPALSEIDRFVYGTRAIQGQVSEFCVQHAAAFEMLAQVSDQELGRFVLERMIGRPVVGTGTFVSHRDEI